MPIRPSIRTRASELALAIPQTCREISSLSFIAYTPSPRLDERLASSPDPVIRRISKQSRSLLNKTRSDLPAHDLVLVSFWPEEKQALLLQEILHHNPRTTTKQMFDIPVGVLTPSKLQEIRAASSKNETLALASLCSLRDGSNAHIPMMDFRCTPNLENLNKIKACLRKILGQAKRGRRYILQSDCSYHFYAFDLVHQTKWIKFLARCLFLAPLTDSRYIAHCLMHGKSTLRISARGRHNREPEVVAVF